MISLVGYELPTLTDFRAHQGRRGTECGTAFFGARGRGVGGHGDSQTARISSVHTDI